MKKIAIHSVPRSGSTWLGAIFDSHQEVRFRMQPLFSYAFKDYLNETSSTQEISNFFIKINESKDQFLNQQEAKENGLIPVFEKSINPTHLCYKEVRYHHILENLLNTNEEIKVVGIIRNPLAVINSWLQAPKEFKPELGWKIEEEWRYAPSKNKAKPEEFNGYEKWKEVALLFLELKNNFPKSFYLIQYEDLLGDLKEQIRKLFSFCDLDLNSQTIQFLSQSSQVNNSDSYAVYKVKQNDDRWKKELPSYIINEIKEDSGFQHLNEIYKWI